MPPSSRRGFLKRSARRRRDCAAAVLLLLASGGTASAGVPFRRALGQAPIPTGDDLDRFQTGSVRVGHFFPGRDGAAAARPDASGTACNLYQLTLLDAFRGSRLGFLADLLAITDRDRGNSALPTQFGYLLGIGTRKGPWRIQFDREEILPLDRKGLSYRYWDARVGAIFETGLLRPKMTGPRYRQPRARDDRRGRLRGELAVGYFLHNNSFPARSDLTGIALLRYNARAVLSSEGGTPAADGRGRLPDRRAQAALRAGEPGLVRGRRPEPRSLRRGLHAREQRYPRPSGIRRLLPAYLSHPLRSSREGPQA
ncbi:MAG: hypothetical protein ABII00_03270 [Elusimicrobiota bacterium]